jgi:hypothetical protein
MRLNGIYLVVSLLCLCLAQAQINFENRAALLGLTIDTGNSIFGGHGVSYADFDGDGFDDITLGTGENEPVRFYKNIDGIIFAEFNLLTGANENLDRTRSVTWVDFDNDGDKDLFVTSDTGRNRLYENTNNSLTDISDAAGFPNENLITYGASWGDIDNDGCLDVYLSNRIGGTNITNYLFKNNCDGTFSDVTEAVGLSNDPALTFCSGFFDFNNDGWQDLYVANDKFEPNYLYKNNGDGTFTDVSFSSGTNIIIDAMSVTIDDFNSDGFLDIYMTNTPQEISTPLPGSVLLKNNGDETFSNISLSSGTIVDSFCWGSNFLDADNNADLDLYINSQYTGDNGFPSYAFFTNSGNETFTQPSNVGFSGNIFRSYSSAIGDYNNDGLMEIIVNNDFFQTPSLWENMANNNNNFIAVTLEGTVSNKDGIGSVIEISVNGNKQYRYTLCGEGYLSQNSSTEIFGLGTSNTIDYIKVRWLSGIEDTIFNVPPNQKLHIVESSSLSNLDYSANSFRYYPNPVANSLFIDAPTLVDSVQILNIQGQMVRQLQPNSLNFAVSFEDLSSGFYVVKLFGAETTIIKKIFKQ